MALERDCHYRDYEPDDMRELREELEVELGEKLADPVWTVGRLDERGPERNQPDTPAEPPA